MLQALTPPKWGILELLKEIGPMLSRVAVIGNSTKPGAAEAFREMQLAGGAVEAQVQYLNLRD
jgi:hypothetical protein